MKFTKIGIIGAKGLGASLAFTCSLKGIPLILVDPQKEQLEKAVGVIKKKVEAFIQENAMDKEDQALLMDRIQLSMDLKSLENIDFVIELISQDEETGATLLLELEKVCKESCIFGSHAALLSITKMAKNLEKPARVLGIHWIQRNSQVVLAELVRAVSTSGTTMTIAKELCEQMGIASIEAHDFPGYSLNRILLVMINEAINTVYEGVASACDVDKACSLSTGQELGPLALADQIGLDEVLKKLTKLYQLLGHAKYMPSPLLVKYVEAGFLGKKSGKGFFEYKKQTEENFESPARIAKVIPMQAT